MNVLGKIVIPKTNVTTQYIMGELEEMEREEFFRLKKVMEIEKKMFGGEKEQKKEPVISETCEKCILWNVIERCIRCNALLLPEVEETQGNEKIEEFKAQLSEIVNITKDMEGQGFLPTSIDEFIKTAEELKEKLDQKSESIQSTKEEEVFIDEEYSKLCKNCKKIYLQEKAEAKIEEPEIVVEPKPLVELPELPPPPPPPLPPPSPPVKPVLYELPDLELGTFETEIKEITKVIRVKKEDGSVTERKKFIRIEKDIKTPIQPQAIPTPNPINQERAGRITYQPSTTSGTSSKSNPYSGSRTIGVVTTKRLGLFQLNLNNNIIQRRVRSEILNSPLPMSDPVIRKCLSSVTLLSVDFGEYSSSFVNSYTDYQESEY